MNTKLWTIVGDADGAIQNAGVRPWFQDAMRRGQYFYFLAVNGRVLCLGTCPSTSLAFSYAAAFTALPITVFVVGKAGPTIAQADDPDAGELFPRWLEHCELEAKAREEEEAWVNSMLHDQPWNHRARLEAVVTKQRGQYFWFEEVNGRVLCLGTCFSASPAFASTAGSSVPITVFVVGPAGPVIAQAGDPDAAEVLTRWLEHCEQEDADRKDTEAWLNAELDYEIWLDTMEQNLAAEEREAAH